jgi:hypothetical protein
VIVSVSLRIELLEELAGNMGTYFFSPIHPPHVSSAPKRKQKYGILLICTICRCKRRRTMGDKGGKKGKEKSQKQKIMKHEHEVQQKKDHQPKSTFGAK